MQQNSAPLSTFLDYTYAYLVYLQSGSPTGRMKWQYTNIVNCSNYLHVHFKLHMSVPATCTHLHSSPPYTVPAIPANCLPSTPCTFNSTYSLFPYTRPLLTVSASFIACLSLSSSSSPSLSFSNSSWHLVSRRARKDFILGVPSSFSPTLILYCI